MSPMKRQFVAEYLVDLCAKDAAIRAGYSPRSAVKKGSDLLKEPEVAAAVEKGMKARERRTNITADRVLEEIAKVAFVDIRQLFHADGRMKLPTELPDEVAGALASVETQEEIGDVPVPADQQQTGRKRKHKGVIGYTKKAKLHDKVAALTLAARHLGMLNDKLAVSGEVTAIVKDYTGRKQ